MRPRVRMTLLTGPISAHFFLSRAARGRCDKQGAEGHPHRARAPRRQPEACRRAADPRYVYSAQSTASLRIEHSPYLHHGRLKSYLIHAVCTQDVAYTLFLQCGCQYNLCLATYIAMALVAFETAAHGRPCRPFIYICTVAVLPGSCVIGRVEGQNTRFLKLIAIVTLSMS